MSQRMRMILCGGLVLGLSISLGCRKDEPKADRSAEVKVQLAAADAHDGTTDQVVSKCVTCNLRMDGTDEHVVTVEGYAVHLCGPECEAAFKKDKNKAILAMKVPKE